MSSPKSSDASCDSRARIQLTFPRSVLISPLWAIIRYGCASSQLGNVFVEKREWTRASALVIRSSPRSGKYRPSCGAVSIPLYTSVLAEKLGITRSGPASRSATRLITIELALEREQITVELGARADEQLSHHRREEACVGARPRAIDRDVAPAQHDLSLGRDRALEQGFELATAVCLLRQEAHGDAVAPGGRQLEADGGAQERIGELDEDPRAVSRLRVRAGSAAMLQVLERAQRLRDRLVTSRAVEARDECHTAGVVLERRVVEPLLPHRHRTPPDSWLVRRGEGGTEPASAVSGAT